MKRYGVFLSGGGFNGAFQAGAIQALSESGIFPAVGYGISVGALNGAKWMMREPDRLTRIWRDITFGDVFGGNRVTNLLFRDGMYNNKPLEKLIEEEIDPERIYGRFYAGAYNLDKKEYVTFSNATPNNTSKLNRGILASTAMPVYHTSVSIEGDKHVDGGVWQVAPIGHFLDLSRDHIDHLIIINCHPENSLAGNEEIKGVLGVAKDTLSVLLQKSIEADFKFFKAINDITRNGKILRSSGKYYEHFPYTLIQPSYFLGSGMNADRDRLDRLYLEGFEAASHVLSSL